MDVDEVDGGANMPVSNLTSSGLTHHCVAHSEALVKRLITETLEAQVGLVPVESSDS